MGLWEVRRRCECTPALSLHCWIRCANLARRLYAITALLPYLSCQLYRYIVPLCQRGAKTLPSTSFSLISCRCISFGIYVHGVKAFINSIASSVDFSLALWASLCPLSHVEATPNHPHGLEAILTRTGPRKGRSTMNIALYHRSTTKLRATVPDQ